MKTNYQISPELMNKALMENVQSKATDINDVYLIHDPSDIRKLHTKKSENIEKVRDLNGNIIKEITRVSKELKQSNPKLKITHIFDREFDDRTYFDLIDSTLFDDFIIRVKKSKL